MSDIFVSYRRDDAAGWAGRLSKDLKEAYGDAAYFFDLDSIPPGDLFKVAIETAVTRAKAVLILIGPHWLELRDETGMRRIDATGDVVAFEVELALAYVPLVIPILVGKAACPSAAALPERLRGLAQRNAFELSDTRWDYDCEQLLRTLDAGTSLRRRRNAAQGSALTQVDVLSGANIVGSETGNVTGVRGVVVSPVAVSVLGNAKIDKSSLGNVTGLDLSLSSTRPDK